MVILTGNSTTHSQSTSNFSMVSRRSPPAVHRSPPPGPASASAPFLIRNLIDSARQGPGEHLSQTTPSSDDSGLPGHPQPLLNSHQLLFGPDPAATVYGNQSPLASALAANYPVFANGLSNANHGDTTQHQMIEHQRQAMAAAQLLWNAAHSGLGAQLAARSAGPESALPVGPFRASSDGQTRPASAEGESLIGSLLDVCIVPLTNSSSFTVLLES